MPAPQSRRHFIIHLGSLAAVSVLPVRSLANAIAPPLYPPLDLSYFDQPITPAPSEIRFGYAAITWDGNDVQAIKDISEVGFRGIQLRTSVLKDFGDQPKALRDLLQQHQLQFIAFSGGGPKGTDYADAEAIATQVKHLAFLREAGAMYLQMTDTARPKDRQPSAEDFKHLGRVLTEIGKRATDAGIPLAYHNHMNSLSEAPAEMEALMEASDARYVKLLFDVAHYQQGGGDPAAAIREYRDRITLLHIKDVQSPVPVNEEQTKPYRFVELGRGKVDLPAVFASLKAINYRGWAVVELDSVPDKTRTPKECALISKKYLAEKLAMKI